MKKIKLRIEWSNKENDFVIHYHSSPTGSFISNLLKPWKLVHPTSLIDPFVDRSTREEKCYSGSLGSYSLLETDWIKELEERGYDKKTLKFEISIKIDQIKEKFPHVYNSLSEQEKIRLGI